MRIVLRVATMILLARFGALFACPAQPLKGYATGAGFPVSDGFCFRGPRDLLAVLPTRKNLPRFAQSGQNPAPQTTSHSGHPVEKPLPVPLSERLEGLRDPHSEQCSCGSHQTIKFCIVQLAQSEYLFGGKNHAENLAPDRNSLSFRLSVLHPRSRLSSPTPPLVVITARHIPPAHRR